MNDIGPNRPPCANPKCDGGAVTVIGRQMYCGVCIMKIMQKKQEKEDKENLEALQ